MQARVVLAVAFFNFTDRDYRLAVAMRIVAAVDHCAIFAQMKDFPERTFFENLVRNNPVITA